MPEYSNLFVVLMGLGTVFAGLLCIILLVTLMSWVCARTSAPKTVPQMPAAPAAMTAPAAVSAAPREADGEAITAPLVGTFYAAPAPDQPPFVSVGDRVKKGQTVCLIEAMKMMSEIPAPCDCEITAVLKENGALVSFREPLFRYQPC